MRKRRNDFPMAVVEEFLNGVSFAIGFNAVNKILTKREINIFSNADLEHDLYGGG